MEPCKHDDSIKIEQAAFEIGAVLKRYNLTHRDVASILAGTFSVASMNTVCIPEDALFRVIYICSSSNRGLFKRIDENRELLELLQKEGSDVLHRFPWIEGWIAGLDCFLLDLVGVLQLKPRGYGDAFPRAWPGKEPHVSSYSESSKIKLCNDESADGQQ